MRLNRMIAAAAAAAMLVPGTLAPAPRDVCFAASEAVSASDDSFQYDVYDDHAEVTSCIAKSSPAVVPESVNGVPVTSVGKNAFFSSDVDAVVFPETVKEIHEHALYGNSLKKVTIMADDCQIVDSGETICTLIEEYAGKVGVKLTPHFWGTIIGNEGSAAQKYAEKYGYTFVDVNKKPTVSYISLVDDDVTYHMWEDHVELAKITYKDTKGNGSIVLPDEVRGLPLTVIKTGSIPDGSFSEITIPASVKVIERGAASCAASLKKLTILSKDCQIFDSGSTVCSSYENRGGTIIYSPKFTGAIVGYKGSTAQKYAENYGYKFEALYKLGDVDEDGIIDSADASMVLEEYAMIQTSFYTREPFDEAQKKAGDVNFDDSIDATDASDILQYFAYTQTGGTLGIAEFLASEE